MPRQVTEENFNQFGFENTGGGHKITPISDDIQQSLARMLVWDYANKQWVLPIADTDGRILVSTSPTKATANNSSNPTVTTTSAAILSENTSRKQALIQNTGAVSVYLGFGEDATVATGFLLIPDAIYIMDVWLGSVTAIVSAGTSTLNIQEMS